ncbi:MAG: HEPN domain-containing protein [Psychrilyobacter sp.]|uniref:HEPN domain-containing protein n=1 Tax=Psychrilyobacter sp. TaxID=2586924 RepID=UPI003C7970E3
MEKWEQLLLRAKNDLITAKKGLIEPKTLDTSAYHCQQCAEKAMKAYLNYRNIDTEDRKLRTHNLLMLLKVCVSQNQEFEKMKKSCGILNPNDTLYRYFNSYQVMPEEDEIIELIELAEDLYNFVVKLVD